MRVYYREKDHRWTEGSCLWDALGMGGQEPAEGPGVLPTAPGALPTAPGALPTAPGALPTATGALPTVPGALPTAPGALPTTPGAVPTALGSLPKVPGALPTAPGALLIAPGALPTVPGAVPTAPGALLVAPGAVPTAPGALPTAPGPRVLAFVGAGGKTSLIRRLAAEGRARGLKVLVTTTTHMLRPSQFGVLSNKARDVEEALERFGIAVVGLQVKEGRIGFPGRALYQESCALADLVLVEADGSRRLPMKVPGPGEPVIPDNADTVLCVCGLSAVGRPGEEAAFRLEEVRGLLKAHGPQGYEGGEGWRITPQIAGALLLHGYLHPLRKAHPRARILPVFNQADIREQAAVGMAVLDDIGEREGLVTGLTDREEGGDLF